MLTNRVTKRKKGYERKKASIELPYTTQHVIDLIDLRCEEGYLLGWSKEKNGLKVYLRYTEEGTPSITKRKRRWKPSRMYTVSSKEMWSVSQINGDRGRLIVQTTQGRITNVEARKKQLGGIVWRWVM